MSPYHANILEISFRTFQTSRVMLFLYRFVDDINDIYKFILTSFFMWNLLTLCCASLIIQLELVEYWAFDCIFFFEIDTFTWRVSFSISPSMCWVWWSCQWHSVKCFGRSHLFWYFVSLVKWFQAKVLLPSMIRSGDAIGIDSPLTCKKWWSSLWQTLNNQQRSVLLVTSCALEKHSKRWIMLQLFCSHDFNPNFALFSRVSDYKCKFLLFHASARNESVNEYMCSAYNLFSKIWSFGRTTEILTWKLHEFQPINL